MPDSNTTQASQNDSPDSTSRDNPENVPALTLTGRVIQACDRCRLKKVRCDGAVPKCERCQRAGLECLATVKLNRKSYPRSYTESIEQRLRQLEAEVYQLRDSNESKDRRIKELESSHSKASVYPSRSAIFRGTVPPVTPHDSFLNRNSNPSTNEPLSREVGRMSLDRHGVGRFMGSSSGIFFVGTAEQKLARINSENPGKIGDALLRIDIDDDTTDYRLQPQTDNAQASIILPSTETAAMYIDAWFDSWKFLLPILHRPSFMSEVNDLYSASPEHRDSVFLALFFLVLALGCRHLLLTGVANQRSPNMNSVGRSPDIDLFSQSCKFWDDILKLNNLRTLQFQEMHAMWYLYTGKRSLAFQVTGSITRLAVELGLHRHSRRFHFDPLTTELRKRAFWICYLLDNFLSAVEGLPKALRDSDIDVEPPSDVDDDFVTADNYLLSLPGEPTGMLLFQSLIKVVRILSNTLEILYTTTERRQTVTKMGIIDQLLDQWLRDLPNHLRLDPIALSTISGDNQATDPAIAFIHLTYLYTQLAAQRVGVSFQPQAPQYWTSLAKCMTLTKELICLNSHCQRFLLVFDMNPGSHGYTIWSCGLMALYGLWEFKMNPEETLDSTAISDLRSTSEACIRLLMLLVAAGRHGEQIRVDNLRELATAVFSRETTPVENTFNQFLQSAYPSQMGDRTNATGCPRTRTQITSSLPESVCSDAVTLSPSLMTDGFNSEYSSVFSHQYGFQPMLSSVGYTPLDQDSNMASQAFDNVQQIWDDPVFNLTAMIPSAESNAAPFAVGMGDAAISRKRSRTDASS